MIKLTKRLVAKLTSTPNARIDTKVGTQAHCILLAITCLFLISCKNTADSAHAISADSKANAIQYNIILSHDGHPDPDDNGAALAGFYAATRNIEADTNQQMKLLAMIYGDTTEKRQQGMLNGGSNRHDKKGKANYEFYQKYTLPALNSVQPESFLHFDITPEDYNYNATQLSDMTSGGQYIAQQLLLILEQPNSRLVVSAGGGQNSAAEAIAYVLKQGISAEQIKANFAIIQHSAWNWKSATENTSKNITADYTIRIEDQNKFSGYLALKTESILPESETKFTQRTSPEFVKAWKSAILHKEGNPAVEAFLAGDTQQGIDNLKGIRDVSDAGSHHFASDPNALNKHWNTRNNGLSVPLKKEPPVLDTPQGPIRYDAYQVEQIWQDLF